MTDIDKQPLKTDIKTDDQINDIVSMSNTECIKTMEMGTTVKLYLKDRTKTVFIWFDSSLGKYGRINFSTDSTKTQGYIFNDSHIQDSAYNYINLSTITDVYSNGRAGVFKQYMSDFSVETKANYFSIGTIGKYIYDLMAPTHEIKLTWMRGLKYIFINAKKDIVYTKQKLSKDNIAKELAVERIKNALLIDKIKEG
jgi:hypothetical protein